MRVLITQSAQDATFTSAQLTARGHQVLSVPSVTAERVTAQPNLANAQGFLVTSPEGARALADAVGVRTFPVFADSEVTAGELRRLKFSNVFAAKDDSQDLARLVERTLKPANGALVYACSTSAAIQLSALLGNMGFAVRMLPLFAIKRVTEMRADLKHALETKAIDAALFLTADEARAFAALVLQEKMEPWVAELLTVAATPIVAAPLRALTLGGVTVPSTGDADTVFGALDQKLVDRVGEERRAREQAARQEAERAKAEAERRVQEQAEQERQHRVAQERAEAERHAQEEAARLACEQAEADKRAREEAARAEAERKRVEQQEAERTRAEQKRLAEQQAAQERAEKARLAAEKAEQERLERERAAAEKARVAAERAEADRIARETAAAERAERDRIEREEAARQHAEKVRLAAEKAERERVERERLAQEQAERERVAREQAETARIERERIAAEKAEQDRVERERRAKEKADFDAAAFAAAEQARAEAQRLAAEQAERDRIAREKAAAEKAERDRLDAERAAAERAEKERLALEQAEQKRLEKERLAAEKAERERIETERAAAERAEKERLALERAEKERLEKERLAAEKAKRARLAQEEKDRAQAEAAQRKAEQAEANRLEESRLALEHAERERLQREQAEAARVEKARAKQAADDAKRVAREKTVAEKAERKALAKAEASTRSSLGARIGNLFKSHTTAITADHATPSTWDIPLDRGKSTEFDVTFTGTPVELATPSATIATAVAAVTTTLEPKPPQPKEHAVTSDLPQVEATSLPPASESESDATREEREQKKREAPPLMGGRAARLQAEDEADHVAARERFRHYSFASDTAETDAIDEHAAEHMEPPPQRKRSGSGRAVGLFVALAFIVIGALWAMPRLTRAPSPAPTPAAVVAQTPAATPNDTAALNARIAALEQKTPPAASQRQSAPVEATQPVSSDAALSLSATVAAQAQQLAAQAARIATLEAAIGSGAKIDELAREIKTLEAKSAQANSVLALSDRVTAIETTSREAVVAHTTNIALLMAIAQWRDTISNGKPFALELEITKAVAARGGSQFDDSAYAGFATRGLPTLGELQRRFGAVAAAAVRADAMPANASNWSRRIYERMLAIITIRRIDGDVAGIGTQAVLARTERRLNENNLADATNELSALTGPAAGVASEWLSAAKARVAAEQSISDITTRAVAALAGDKPVKGE